MANTILIENIILIENTIKLLKNDIKTNQSLLKKEKLKINNNDLNKYNETLNIINQIYEYIIKHLNIASPKYKLAMNNIIKRIIKLMIFNNRLFDYLHNEHNKMYDLGYKDKQIVNNYDEYYHMKLNQYNNIIYKLLKDK